jgi:hypothetical protein
MRMAFALAILLGGAVSASSAEPEKWCSSGFEAPAVLSNSGAGFVLKIGSKTETFVYGGGVGTGLNGQQLIRTNGEIEVLNDAEMTTAVDPNKPEIIPVLLFRDRVFWPCP